MAEQMYPDRIAIAYTPADVVRIVNAGKLVAAIGIIAGRRLNDRLVQELEAGLPVGTVEVE